MSECGLVFFQDVRQPKFFFDNASFGLYASKLTLLLTPFFFCERFILNEFSYTGGPLSLRSKTFLMCSPGAADDILFNGQAVTASTATAETLSLIHI